MEISNPKAVISVLIYSKRIKTTAQMRGRIIISSLNPYRIIYFFTSSQNNT